MRWVFLILRAVLGATFLYAGIAKASASSQFFLTLLPFTFIPEELMGPISIILPIVEILAALMVMIWPRQWGAVVIFLLCVLFTAVIGWALANGIIVDCGCFGNDTTPSAAKMALALGRDAVLAVMAAAVFFEKRLRR